MNYLFLPLVCNPNCLRTINLCYWVSSQTKPAHEWERRKQTSNGERGFPSFPHCIERILPRETALSWLCFSRQKLFLIPKLCVVVEGVMKLLALTRILLGRNLMNKHHRQWVEGKIVEIYLERELSNQLSLIAKGFWGVPQSLEKIFITVPLLYYCFLVYKLSRVFCGHTVMLHFNLSLKGRTNR